MCYYASEEDEGRKKEELKEGCFLFFFKAGSL